MNRHPVVLLCEGIAILYVESICNIWKQIYIITLVSTTMFNQIKGRDENGDGNIARPVQDCLD